MTTFLHDRLRHLFKRLRAQLATLSTGRTYVSALERINRVAMAARRTIREAMVERRPLGDKPASELAGTFRAHTADAIRLSCRRGVRWTNRLRSIIRTRAEWSSQITEWFHTEGNVRRAAGPAAMACLFLYLLINNLTLNSLAGRLEDQAEEHIQQQRLAAERQVQEDQANERRFEEQRKAADRHWKAYQAETAHRRAANSKCHTCSGSGRVTQRTACSGCKGRGRVLCDNSETWNPIGLIKVLTWGAAESETYHCRNGRMEAESHDSFDRNGTLCDHCSGAGYRDCSKCDGYGHHTKSGSCRTCDGDGKT